VIPVILLGGNSNCAGLDRRRLHKPQDFGLGLMALVALMFWKLPFWLVVLGTGCIGLFTFLLWSAALARNPEQCVCLMQADAAQAE
jgi:hypothetical protein